MKGQGSLAAIPGGGPEARNLASFYVTGGTLQGDAGCYVTRQADRTLYQGLRQGRLCYLLTSRQMGKSSLMVRTAWRLREAGDQVVVLDLTAIGQNLTAEQWYEGLLSHAGRQLRMEDELDQFWLERSRLGPLQRWMRALTDVVLPRCPGRLVVFVDEIDSLQSLPFASGEFFAGVRELYNRRAEEPDLERMCFCLLGVASPSDLIRDTRTTPFNIGMRIELPDFTHAEANVLAEGFEPLDDSSGQLLGRILDWTGGHPYLTQRLCQAVAMQLAAGEAADVDSACAELFFALRSQLQDDNLLFVRERLLRSEVDPAGLLTVYERVLRGRSVPDDVRNPTVETLKLSGIVRGRSGFLAVRNRIYREVFDRKWVRDNLPDAELRRQRAAYRRGWLRAAAIAAAVLAMVGSIAILALQQRDLAERERARAQAQELENRRLLYAAHMKVAQQGWETSDVPRIEDLLLGYLPEPGREDLRGFEWYYLWKLCCGDSSALRHGDEVRTLAFSPNGRIFASGSMDRTVKLWDLSTRKELATLRGHQDTVLAVVFSPDGELLASASSDHTVKLWNVAARREVATLEAHSERVLALAMSPDGKLLASASQDRTVKLWELPTGRLLATLSGHRFQIWSVAFSPDGKTLATASWDGTAKLWDLSTTRERLTLEGHSDVVTSVAFSPDGKTVATGSYDRSVKLWNTETGEETLTLSGSGRQKIWVIAFSPDGSTLATGGVLDRSVRLWDVATAREVADLHGHSAQISALAFSPDGTTLVTGGGDRTIKLWDVASGEEAVVESPDRPETGVPAERPLADIVLSGHRGKVSTVAFSAGGLILASGGEDGTVKLWNAADGRELLSLERHRGAVNSVAFTPDARQVVSGSEDRTVMVWDLETGRPLAVLNAHAAPVRSVAVAPDGRTLATGSADGSVKLWDVLSRQERANLDAHRDKVESIAFSPDGETLATASSDRTVKLWDVAGGRLRSVLSGHRSDVLFVSFSPDGETLATGSADYFPKLWNVATGEEVATLRGALSVAFSPDGKTLATGASGGDVILWNVETRTELIILKGHLDYVPAVVFSPDGKTLATGSSDGTIRLWRASTDEEVSARVATAHSERARQELN